MIRRYRKFSFMVAPFPGSAPEPLANLVLDFARREAQVLLFVLFSDVLLLYQMYFTVLYSIL